MKKQPTLSSIAPAQTQYQAGDRIVVRLSRAWTDYERRQCEKSVNGWCGVDVNQLFVDCSSFVVVVRRVNGDDATIAGLDAKPVDSRPDQLNMSCVKVTLLKGDSVECHYRASCNTLAQFRLDLIRWVGQDNEVIFIPWMA